MLALSKDRTPLVGRSAESETLVALLEDVDRTGAVLVLRGDPGIGRSRLLAIRTGLEDATVLPDGRRASGNADLVRAAAAVMG